MGTGPGCFQNPTQGEPHVSERRGRASSHAQDFPGWPRGSTDLVGWTRTLGPDVFIQQGSEREDA